MSLSCSSLSRRKGPAGSGQRRQRPGIPPGSHNAVTGPHMPVYRAPPDPSIRHAPARGGARLAVGAPMGVPEAGRFQVVIATRGAGDAVGGVEEVAVQGVKIAPEVRREVLRLRGQGLSISQIVARVDVSQGSVAAMLRPLGGVIRKDMLTPSGRRLSLPERVEIKLGLERGWSYRRIGAQLGRAASTVCREAAAGGGGAGYRPVAAQDRAAAAARRPKPRKLADPLLCAAVSERLGAVWSARQVGVWL